MLNSFFTQFDTAFTQSDMLKLQRDVAMGDHTLAALDASSPYSWPKQAAGIAGDAWVSAAGDSAPVPGNGALTGPVAWANGGFIFGPASTDIVTLPSTPFQLATNENERLLIFGFRHDAQVTAASGGTGIICSDTVAANSQWGIYANKSASGNGQIQITGIAGAIRHIISAAPAAGSFWHIGIHIKRITTGADTGKYQYNIFVNGLAVASYTYADTALPAPTGAPGIGRWPGANTDWNGKFYRAVADPLLDGLNAAETIARDYLETAPYWA